MSHRQMSRFEAILWDLDGTLLDFLYAQRLAITRCLESIGREATEEIIQHYSEINDSYWKRFELGEVTKEQLLTGRFVSLFDAYQITDADVTAFRMTYQENLGKVYRYLDDSFELCSNLRGRVKQYIITNGNTSVQENKLRLSGLAELMDGIFISEQIGTPKPKKEFFDYCLNVMTKNSGIINKDRLLIVGDSLTSDIKGGVLSGIPTCWYRPDDIFETDETARENYEKYRPDYEISHLSQIYEILGLERQDEVQQK